MKIKSLEWNPIYREHTFGGFEILEAEAIEGVYLIIKQDGRYEVVNKLTSKSYWEVGSANTEEKAKRVAQRNLEKQVMTVYNSIKKYFVISNQRIK